MKYRLVALLLLSSIASESSYALTSGIKFGARLSKKESASSKDSGYSLAPSPSPGLDEIDPSNSSNTTNRDQSRQSSKGLPRPGSKGKGLIRTGSAIFDTLFGEPAKPVEPSRETLEAEQLAANRRENRESEKLLKNGIKLSTQRRAVGRAFKQRVDSGKIRATSALKLSKLEQILKNSSLDGDSEELIRSLIELLKPDSLGDLTLSPKGYPTYVSIFSDTGREAENVMAHERTTFSLWSQPYTLFTHSEYPEFLVRRQCASYKVKMMRNGARYPAPVTSVNAIKSLVRGYSRKVRFAPATRVFGVTETVTLKARYGFRMGDIERQVPKKLTEEHQETNFYVPIHVTPIASFNQTAPGSWGLQCVDVLFLKNGLPTNFE